jgi:hypothetical protein
MGTSKSQSINRIDKIGLGVNNAERDESDF